MHHVVARRAAGEYALDMIAYDDDVISLELDSAFRDCIVDGDSTPLYYMAAAIMRLQGLFGLIPRVQVCCRIQPRVPVRACVRVEGAGCGGGGVALPGSAGRSKSSVAYRRSPAAPHTALSLAWTDGQPASLACLRPSWCPPCSPPHHLTRSPPPPAPCSPVPSPPILPPARPAGQGPGGYGGARHVHTHAA